MVYMTKKDFSVDKKIVADDMMLTCDMPTAAGSKMLDGFVSLVGSEALARLAQKGYNLVGKTNVGEFGFDVMGETSHFGAEYQNGVLAYPAAVAVQSGEVSAAVVMDNNGAPRRAAAQSGLVCLKPTYGTVSRYGTVPIVCSGETVSVLAQNAADALAVYADMKGHDGQDGTSHSDAAIAEGEKTVSVKNKVALPVCMLQGITAEVKAKIDAAKTALQAKGITVCEIQDSTLSYAKAAWNILMSAELCNNVSRYDGVKFGYRSQNYTSIDELYTASRTEAFGDTLKAAILFGSETLSTDNYKVVYDKALRVRRLLVEYFAKLHTEYDAVLMPACSVMGYTEQQIKANKYLCFEENFYTAPASITGLPVAVASGVQMVGPAFSEEALTRLAQIL